MILWFWIDRLQSQDSRQFPDMRSAHDELVVFLKLRLDPSVAIKRIRGVNLVDEVRQVNLGLADGDWLVVETGARDPEQRSLACERDCWVLSLDQADPFTVSERVPTFF